MNKKPYRVIANISWIFESDLSLSEVMTRANSLLSDILNENPYGPDYENFSVSVDLATLKERKKPIHLTYYSVDHIVNIFKNNEKDHIFHYDGKDYKVKFNKKLKFFVQKDLKCAACGMEAEKFALDLSNDKTVSLNLYGMENGRLVMFTRDHITPKSLGGQNASINYQVMCEICNNLKSNSQITCEDIKKLRELKKSKLIPKKLKKCLKENRKKMENENGK